MVHVIVIVEVIPIHLLALKRKKNIRGKNESLQKRTTLRTLQDRRTKGTKTWETIAVVSMIFTEERKGYIISKYCGRYQDESKHTCEMGYIHIKNAT